jgi:hypothetical protein
MHHTDVAEESVDPNGKGASATVENSSKGESLFAVERSSDVTVRYRCRRNRDAQLATQHVAPQTTSADSAPNTTT